MAYHGLTTLSNTAPTRLTPLGTHSGMDITIQNANTAGYIFIGVDDTTSATNYGFRLIPDQAISFELAGTDALYAIGQNDAMVVATLQIDLESQD